jgi:hypothetical protein
VGEVELQAVHEAARVALILCEKAAGVSLRPNGSAAAGVSIQATVYDLEVGRILVQTHLKVEDRWPTCAAELFPELDVKDAAGGGPTYRCEYALPVRTINIVKVGPVRGDQVIHGCRGQASVGERGIITCKLQVAV